MRHTRRWFRLLAHMPKPTTELPPAGWLYDPSMKHQERYWTGAEWSDQVRDDDVETTAKAPRSWLTKWAPPGSRRGRAQEKLIASHTKGVDRSSRLAEDRANRKANKERVRELTDSAYAIEHPPVKCPFCQKRLKAKAFVCHHCGRDAREAHGVAPGQV